VPAELSVVAFDDSVLTQLMHPALTALSRDTIELGRQAADVLLELLADPTSAVSRRTPTPVLTVRESTAPPQRPN
jgi:DNA-binding LacI/PurR family transcriptional regulator